MSENDVMMIDDESSSMSLLSDRNCKNKDILGMLDDVENQTDFMCEE
jgi:hypothetical protein